MPDSREIERKLADTEPAKVREMKTEEIIEWEQYFAGQLPIIASSPLFRHYRAPWQSRTEFLGSVIARRDLAKQTERHHRALHVVGKKTLNWARIAAWAGIAAVLVAIASLIYQIYSSKVPPATSAPASPPTSLQTPPTTGGSLEPEANSNSAAASPEQAATAQPSVSPPESSARP